LCVVCVYIWTMWLNVSGVGCTFPICYEYLQFSCLYCNYIICVFEERLHLDAWDDFYDYILTNILAVYEPFVLGMLNVTSQNCDCFDIQYEQAHNYFCVSNGPYRSFFPLIRDEVMIKALFQLFTDLCPLGKFVTVSKIVKIFFFLLKLENIIYFRQPLYSKGRSFESNTKRYLVVLIFIIFNID